MNDDWRLQIDLHEEGRAHALTERLDAEQLERDLSDAFHDRVIVNRDGARVFLYTGTREQAGRARDVVEADAKQHDWTVDVEFGHWHPTAEDWEDPDKPLPEDDAAKLVEHEVLIAREREEEARTGHPEFEVRVDLPSPPRRGALFRVAARGGLSGRSPLEVPTGRRHRRGHGQ